MSEYPSDPRARIAFLNARRQAKMSQSAHAYVRGNTADFYGWIAGEEVQSQIPKGPPIWICGDCHIGNLGPVADLEGNVEIQIRDLDQTVIGNPAFDILRLALSLAMASRSSDLPGVTTALMLERLIQSYCEGLIGKNRRARRKLRRYGKSCDRPLNVNGATRKRENRRREASNSAGTKILENYR